METNGLFSGTIPLLSRALDLRSTRHNLLASNIANMDTPQYKAFDLMVEEELSQFAEPASALEMQQTQAGHMSPGGSNTTQSPRLIGDQSPYFQSVEGNTVDIDRTMAGLTENSLKFAATSQIISKKFRGLKNVIQGGGRSS